MRRKRWLAAEERRAHRFLAYRVSWLNMTVDAPEGRRFRCARRVYHGQRTPQIRADERCSQHRCRPRLLRQRLALLQFDPAAAG
jgi:hypothetical protein